MKGVSNKLADSAKDAPRNDRRKKSSQNRDKGQPRIKSITPDELVLINRRLDQCLPMETPEWQRVEQLLMQMSEFAPRLLVYETGMAVALYADDQARRAYLLGAADGEANDAADGRGPARELVSA